MIPDDSDDRKHTAAYPLAEVRIPLDDDLQDFPEKREARLLFTLLGAIVRVQDPQEHGGLIPFGEMQTVATSVVADAMATGLGHYVADEIGDPHRVTAVHILRHSTYWRVCAKRCLVHCRSAAQE